MTATIDPTDDTAPDAGSADEPAESGSPLRYVLLLALAGSVLVAAVIGIVFVVLNDPPPSPVPVAEVAAPAPAGPSATATPEERFLAAWHVAAPGVAARRGDRFWAELGVSTCNLIGRPFINEDLVVRALGSNPQLMSGDEGRAFLDVVHTELCPQNEYGPQLQAPSLRPASPLTLPDLGSTSSSSGGASSIPTVRVSPPSVGRAPTIPGTGSGGGSSGDGVATRRPDIQPLPENPLRPQPVN